MITSPLWKALLAALEESKKSAASRLFSF